MSSAVQTMTEVVALERPASGRRRRRRDLRTPGERFVVFLAIPVFAVIAFFVVMPMVQTAITSAGGAGLAENYSSFLSGATQRALLLSVGISIATVILCAIVGTLMAVLLTRFDFPGRRLLEVLSVLPLALPPLIGAVSFTLLFNETGIVPRALGQLGIDPASVAVSGVGGVLLVHVFTMYPYFYLSVAAGLAGMDTSIEEAAANLGAPRWRVWLNVVLPMLTPALVAGALLTFMTSMASFTAPQLYNVQTLTMQIVATRTGGNYALAATQSTVLAAVSIGFLFLMRWYQGRQVHRSLSKGVQRSRTRASGWMAGAAAAGATVLSLVLIAPVAAIVLVSFSVNRSWTTEVLPPEYTLDNYVSIFTDPESLLPINVSVQMALYATLGAVVIGGAAAWVISKWPLRRGRGAMDAAIMLPWALPGTVIGINIVTAFASPEWFNLGLVLVGSLLILPIAYFVRYVPLVFRETGASIDTLDPSVDEAAQSLGASPLRAIATVVLPLVWKGVLAGALLAFIDGVGEYVASVIVYPAGYAPMSVEIYNRLYSADVGSAAAYGTLQIALIFVVLLITTFLERRSGRRGKKGAAPAAETAVSTAVGVR
ncbi:iron ABC transporter permease [Microbacterium sp. HD4P20]|uniref:ABC transporter permease n=1 Tax=Microbacterium sp. HD4P20 TaxID=2864874 RepID=UPI0020A2BBB3|nr:iron ABC transporter permease [Microbacterium sp. HD4P20]MCP2638418.1 iron ABC transporter permease [Microbacterium sp. HD4P20]